MEIIIALSHLSKDYQSGVKALDDINLAIAEGEWAAIMGPSGSGKTTLLNIIGCLDRPTVGMVKVAGTDLSRLKAQEMAQFRREKIGLIFQQFYLVPYLNALENVMLAQYFHSMPDKAQAVEALVKVGLGHRLHHLPSQLSGGEQQRVCIARALINEPKIILADEPTGNLDADNEKTVLDLLERLHLTGTTLIVVTHDWSIGSRAQRCVRLEHGKVVDNTRG